MAGYQYARNTDAHNRFRPLIIADSLRWCRQHDCRHWNGERVNNPHFRPGPWDAARLKGTSECWASRLARGNPRQQTHRETSSNYLCTNDELGTGGMTPM